MKPEDTEKKRESRFTRLKLKEIIRGNFLALLVSWTVWRFSMRLSGPYRSPFIIEVLKGTPTILGIISSIQSTIRLLVFIPGGAIADNWGRKKIISIFTFFIAASSLFYVFAVDWTWALAAVIFQSISAIYMPALRATTADSLPPEYRGIGFALQSYLPSLPAIFSPMIGAYLIEIYGYNIGTRLAFCIQFICGIIAATIRLLFLKETLIKEEEKQEIKETMTASIKVIKEIPIQLKTILIASIVGEISRVIDQYRILYATGVKKLEVMDWGTILSISNASTIVLGLIIGYLLDRYGKRKIAAIMGMLLMTSTIFFINSYNFQTFLLSMIIIGSTRFGASSGLRALQADLTPRELRGRVNAAGMIIQQLILIIIGFIAGIGYENNPIIPFLIDLTAALTATILLISIIREPEKRYV